MKTRLLSVFLIVFGIPFGYAATIDLGSGYTYWSSFKPGTMVSFRCLATGSGPDRDAILTFRLKSVDPDLAILDLQETALSGPGGSAQRFLSPIEFKATEFARNKEDLFHGMLNIHIAREIDETEAPSEKGVEDLSVKGIRIRTDRVRHVYESSGVRNTVTVWISDEIPGKVGKIVREIRTGPTSLREEFTAVDFLALRAAPDEILRMRASRKPVLVEVPAHMLLSYETRFFDDMESLQKLVSNWAKVLSTIVPDSPDTDLNEFKKYLYSYQENIGQLKRHWAEDRPSIEAKLETSSKEKIRPMLEAITRYADALGKPLEWIDRILILDDKSSVYEKALAFDEEMQGSKSEAIAASRKLQEEFKNIRLIKLKYLR